MKEAFITAKEMNQLATKSKFDVTELMAVLDKCHQKAIKGDIHALIEDMSTSTASKLIRLGYRVIFCRGGIGFLVIWPPTGVQK
jgi:hypothetical protein